MTIVLARSKTSAKNGGLGSPLANNFYQVAYAGNNRPFVYTSVFNLESFGKTPWKNFKKKYKRDVKFIEVEKIRPVSTEKANQALAKIAAEWDFIPNGKS